MTRHTLELRVDDDHLWWSIQRKKLEYKEKYGCNNWIQVLYKWANMPTLSDDNQIKCEKLYEVMGKTKSPELKKKCQTRLAELHPTPASHVEQIITAPTTKAEALNALIRKRDQLLEMIDDEDMDEAHHAQCVEMLVAMDKVIKDNGP